MSGRFRKEAVKAPRRLALQGGNGLNVLALCAGIGGLELGVKIACPSARCVCYVEGEAYAASILIQRMAEKSLDEAPVWSNVRTFDGNPWRGKVDCITGGYPCQPFSKTGKRLGDKDPRNLWLSIKRIISEIQPRRLFFENVPNHLRMGFEQVATDLCGLGYRVAAGLFTASEVGASHERERLYFMADSDSRTTWNQYSPACRPEWETGGFHNGSALSGRRASECRASSAGCAFHGVATFPPCPDDDSSWDAIFAGRSDFEPGLCRVVDGVPFRMDRYRACGNAVVPLVAAYAWRTLEACF